MEMTRHISYKYFTVIPRRHNKTGTCLKHLLTSGTVSVEMGKTVRTIWYVYVCVWLDSAVNVFLL
jgi:hypothetical protein